MRKVLSFVLVLALVLSSFSMAFAADTTPAAVEAPATTTPAPVVAPVVAPAPVETVANAAGLSDINGIVNEEAVKVVNNLGIVTGNPDGTFAPEKAVNRAEFAAMITRALGIPQSALAGYTKVSFKDCNGYGWAVPFLAFCESKGIMLGDGQGNAMPGRTINTNEAATMICRALGYTANSSVLVGVWPANYVSLAQDLGVYDDCASVLSVDKANAAQMIYNSLTVQKVQVAADGTTTQMVDARNAAVTMLTSGLGCTDEGYGVVDYDADAVINTVPYIGMYAKSYTNKAGNLISVDEKESVTLVGEFTDNDTSGTLTVGDEFDADDVTYTVKDVRFHALNNDGTAVAAWTAMDEFVDGENTAIGTYVDGDSYTFNVKLSNKNVVEIYSVSEWTVDGAAKVVTGDLASVKDGSLLGFDFATDKKDNIIEKSFELLGVNSLNDIKADNIVYVYEDAGRDEISKVAVGTEVVTGKVTKIDGTDTWTVNGKAYDFGLNGKNGSDRYADELNNEVKLFLDAYGDIYKYDVTSGSAKDYAVVVMADVLGTADGNMKLYLADDSKKTFSSDLESADWTFVKGNVVVAGTGVPIPNQRLIGYGLNKDGEIDGIYPAATDGAKWQNGTGTFKSNTVVTGLSGTVKVMASDVVVFTKEGTGNTVVSGVAKIADVDKDTAITGVEALVRDGEIVAIIVDEDAVSGSSDATYAVIDGVKSAVNPAGDKAQVLTGYIDGKKMAADTVYTAGTSTVSGTDKVNVFELKYDADKNISKATKLDTAVVGTTNSGIAGGKLITANGYTSDKYIKTDANGGTVTAVADNAVFYEVKFDGASVDEYKIWNGTIYAGMKAWIYDTDDDNDGAEVVIIYKNSITSYNDLTLSVAPATYTVVAASSQAAVNSIATATAVDGNGSYTYAINDIVAGTATLTTTGAFTIGSATGVINYVGTTASPTVAGTVTVTVGVTDGLGNTDTETFVVTIE